jgi:hypothetical protein
MSPPRAAIREGSLASPEHDHVRAHDPARRASGQRAEGTAGRQDDGGADQPRRPDMHQRFSAGPGTSHSLEESSSVAPVSRPK